ncbi:MAG TPA: glycosyltransferase family 2 protein, partial [Candidatus Eisenbacteria bacterium]|nr:glycosyltransferase family 2 protein [Candidatus Eisenbacteria bacterium]
TNRLGNGVLTLTAMLLFLRRIRDSQSGMWVFHRRVLDRIRVTSDGMPFSQEIKLEAIRRGFRFGEAHIAYGARVGEVKLQKWRDGWRNLAFLFRKRLGLV